MNIIKQLLIVALVVITTSSAVKAQDYAKVNYWSKDYNLDRTFFEFLNRNMDYFIKVTAPQLKSYDNRDYNQIYVAVVDCLKKPDNTIIVTEANQLQFSSNKDIIPGQLNEPGRSKKSSSRAATVLLRVVLPSLEEFVKSYNATHQFQY